MKHSFPLLLLLALRLAIFAADEQTNGMFASKRLFFRIRAYFTADSEHVFKITMAGPPEGTNVSEKEFAEILNSIAIGRK